MGPRKGSEAIKWRGKRNGPLLSPEELGLGLLNRVLWIHFEGCLTISGPFASCNSPFLGSLEGCSPLAEDQDSKIERLVYWKCDEAFSISCPVAAARRGCSTSVSFQSGQGLLGCGITGAQHPATELLQGAEMNPQ